MNEYIDFKCEHCEVQFWVETKKNNIAKLIERTQREECPNCGKVGSVKRIPTPDRYIV